MFKLYCEFADTVTERIDSGVKNRLSPITLTHPWFGQLTAKDWYWLLGIHSRIHLKQIREIKKNLNLAQKA